jgi:ubiquinone/menaquinone biosynthesis C-methylase UbiE
MDVSKFALANARRTWGVNEQIKWEIADICEVSLPSSEYDIIIAYGLLHCLTSTQEIRAVVAKLKRATKKNGYNIICVFNNRSQDLTAHQN